MLIDQNWKKCDKDKATYYRITNEVNAESTSGNITDFWMNDNIYRKGRYINGKKKGYFVYYHESGNTKSEGRYSNDKRVGAWKYYYEDGSPWQNVYYEKGQRYVDQYWNEQGKLKVDLGSGEYEGIYEYNSITLREIGSFTEYQKDGIWKGYTQEGELYFEERYKNGELLQAHSFDEEGNKIPYQKKIEYAAPSDGLDAFYEFVEKEMKYPTYTRQKYIQGKVLIKVVVDKNGKLLEAKAISSPHQVLSEEAVSVVKKYNKWKSGKEMGKPVQMFFIIPLTFDLSGSPASTFN